MLVRRSLHLPITLAIVMIAILVVLTVGWVLLAVFGALANTRFAGLNWTLLSVGTTFIALLLVGVIMYLGLSVKAINFTRRQSNFIDSVTHEFKSPIASMKLCLQTLNRRQVGPEEQAAFYQYMLDDLDRLDHLITQVLEAGRLDTETGRDDKENVAMVELLQDCARTICHRYRVPPEIVHFDAQDCRVRARRVDLEIIFRNLIDNAVKYAGPEPRVEVALRLDGRGRALARIGDNGRGIPPRLRRRIFRRFERLGTELEREKPGTGLGLYIVHALVRRLGGRVRVLDREDGPGALFEVKLPIGQAPPDDVPRESPPQPDRHETSPNGAAPQRGES